MTNVTVFSEKTFVEWACNAFWLTEQEARMLWGYVEGHGYELHWIDQKDLFLVDKEDPEHEPELLYDDIADLIERIGQWNYEFLLDDAVTGEWRERVERDAHTIANICEPLGNRRGYYIGYPTVKEMIAILSKLPQDYKVTCCGGENYLYRFEQNKYITIDHEDFL